MAFVVEDMLDIAESSEPASLAPELILDLPPPLPPEREEAASDAPSKCTVAVRVMVVTGEAEEEEEECLEEGSAVPPPPLLPSPSLPMSVDDALVAAVMAVLVVVSRMRGRGEALESLREPPLARMDFMLPLVFIAGLAALPPLLSSPS